MNQHAEQHCLWRADVYRLLALGLEASMPERLQVVSGICRELLDTGYEAPLLWPLLQRLAQAVEGDADEIVAEHLRLFTAQTSCPSCEGSYLLAERGPVIGDVTAFYSAFGVQAAEQQGPPDAITMELGFMSFLALKEAHQIQSQDAEGIETIRSGQILFLRDHLGRWVRAFSRRLQLEARNEYFQTIACLLPVWLDHESAVFGVSFTEAPSSLPSMGEEELQCALHSSPQA